MKNNKNRWGFIALWRKTREHWLWNDKRPRTKFEAWVDLLWLASHEPQKKLIQNQLVNLKTGQRDLSIRFLSERWKWSKNKVIRYIDLLENDEMVSTDTSTGQTIVTICNYETYQIDWRKTSTPTDTQTDTVTDTQTDTQARHQRIQREELIIINKNLKEKEESDLSSKDGINQPDSEFTSNDQVWAIRQWKKIHERFNLHHDSYNGYTGIIIDCYKRIGKERVIMGIENFLNDSKSGISSITYFFKTGIDRYLMRKDFRKGKDHEARVTRIKEIL